MRAQHGEGAQVRALAEKVQIVVGNQRAEGVGIGITTRRTIGPFDLQAVIQTVFSTRQLAFPQAVGVPQCQIGNALAGADRLMNRYLQRARQKGAHPQRAAAVGVHSEHRKRIGMAAANQGIKIGSTEHMGPYF